MKLKKCLGILLCSVLLFTVICSVDFSAKADTLYGISNGSNVRMRNAATTSGSSVVYKFVEANQKVIILEAVEGQEAEVGNGTTWYKVQTLNGAYIGYVYGVYVTVIPPEPTPETPPVVTPDFEEQLAAFPESYHASLRVLHNLHPEWIFVADNLTMSFETAVLSQYNNVRKSVELSQGIAWRSMQYDQYYWDTDTWKILDGGRWVAASKEVIGYYMDPRNFLDETAIYMFMKQGYDSKYQTEAGLSRIVNGTFLANGYAYNSADPVDARYGGSYIKVIMAAANASGVSPYVIAAKIITEQGSSGTSALISGTYGNYQGYYNFFNFGASGSGQATVIANGLQTAKNEGWDSRADSIIGGAKKLADGYVNANQDTYFYMDFNVKTPDKDWHQYASAAYDAYTKGQNLSKAYKGSFDSAPLVFSIPVYTSIPAVNATKPAAGDNRYNNYYLTALEADGLNPAFNMYTQNYSLSITKDTVVYLETPATASVISPLIHQIESENNVVEIVVQSQSGYTNSYFINVYSPFNCTLRFTTQREYIEWEINENGTLKIWGNGPLSDFTTPQNAPWYEHSETITKVLIGESITKIGNNAFSSLKKLAEITVENPDLQYGTNVFDADCDIAVNLKNGEGYTPYSIDIIDGETRYVQRRSSRPDAPQIVHSSGSTVVLKVVSGCEYSADGENWQSYNVFTGLEKDKTYNFCKRVAATETLDASRLSETKGYVWVSAPEINLVGGTKVTFKNSDGFLYSVDAAYWEQGSLSGLVKGQTYFVFKRPLNTDENTYLYYETVSVTPSGNDSHTELGYADVLVMIQNHILIGGNNLGADINGDGKVNLVDLVRYKKTLANL